MESRAWAFSTRWCWERVLQRHPWWPLQLLLKSCVTQRDETDK